MRSTFLRVGRTHQAARALWRHLNPPNHFATRKDGIAGYRLSSHARGGRHAFHLPWRWIEANLPKGGKVDAPEA